MSHSSFSLLAARTLRGDTEPYMLSADATVPDDAETLSEIRVAVVVEPPYESGQEDSGVRRSEFRAAPEVES